MKNSSITSGEFSLEKWMQNPLEEMKDLDNLDNLDNSDNSDNFNQLNKINSGEVEEEIEEEFDNTQFVHQEFVDPKVVTLKQRRIQGNIYFHWRNFNDSRQQRGHVYTDVPCVADAQEWYPSVAYITPQLLKYYGEPDVFPQSFPLIAEIVSLTDLAEEVIAKAQMYLHCGSEEVWLIFPENHWIIVITSSQQLVFTSGEIIYTQRVLQGFTAQVDELLA